MSKQEVIMIMAMLGAFYSGGKNDPKNQAEAWYQILYKYDFKTAQKAVLNFAENDVRDYATFPAVGVIVKEIRAQKAREEKPIREVIKAIAYGKPYEDISDTAKGVIGKAKYNEWKAIDAEEFASKADQFADRLRKLPMMIE